MNAAYSEYLRSPHWQMLRRRKLFGGYFCRGCGTHNELQVHHLVYRSDLTKTTLKELLVLCDPCHEIVHKDAVLVAWLARTNEPNKRSGRIIKFLRRLSGFVPQLIRRRRVEGRKLFKARFR